MNGSYAPQRTGSTLPSPTALGMVQYLLSAVEIHFLIRIGESVQLWVSLVCSQYIPHTKKPRLK